MLKPYVDGNCAVEGSSTHFMLAAFYRSEFGDVSVAVFDSLVIGSRYAESRARKLYPWVGKCVRYCVYAFRRVIGCYTEHRRRLAGPLWYYN
jgi:hypothetical protein